MIRLYRMDCLNAIKLLAVLTFVHATNGQTVTVSDSSRVAAATNVPLTCTVNGGTSNGIQWVDVTGGASTVIYTGSSPFSIDLKYSNFNLTSLSSTVSVMTIENAEVEDDGDYRCLIPTDPVGATLNLVVEAASTVTVTLDDTVTNNEDMYVATCDAVGGKPQETLTWALSGIPQTDGNGNTIVETNPPATIPLSNTKSVFTFPATLENYRQTLVCQVSGHVLTELNGQEFRDLDIHTSPSAVGTTVNVDYVTQETGIRVSCSAQNEPRPAMRNYYIFSNDTLIHESMEGGNEVTVEDPEEGTEYTCIAGNYLGNTTLSAAVPYDPTRTTTPPPTTAPEGTTSGDTVGSGGTGTDPAGLSAGALAGIAIGVIACIVIIVVVILYLVKPECCPCFATAGSKSSGSSKKPAGSAVGSSNGSEKDKINKPEAAPRGQGSIQHTANNPGQELYALPERKQPAGGRGGDAPDRGSGPGQNEPQGMLYADLDLSSKAGHTEKHVPKNENDVVVYSSILV